MYEASQIIGLATKIARDPNAAVKEIIEESNTASGKLAVSGMKENLCKRYNCRDIELEVHGVLVSINMTEVSGDVSKTAQIIVSDLQEIMEFISIADRKINVGAMLRSIKIIHKESEKTISVTMPLEPEMADKVKKALGGEVKND